MRLLASRNTLAFPASLVKRDERMVISGEIRSRGLCSRLCGEVFVHDCLVIVSSDFYARLRCVGEQIFLTYS